MRTKLRQNRPKTVSATKGMELTGNPKVETRTAVSKRRKSGEPLYLQVANALQDEIVRGVYPVGSQLPKEDDLCARFSVSRQTVREALRRMRENNLVSSRQGSGTVVVARDSESSFYNAVSIDDLLDYARGTRLVIRSMQLVEVDRDLAEDFGLAEGSSWLKVEVLRIRDDSGETVCGTDFYINAKFAAVGRMLQYNTGSFFPLIEDMFGVRIAEVYQEIMATNVDERQAETLNAKLGTAALEIHRTYRMADGEIMQFSISLHPGSTFRHTSTMRLSKPG